MTQHDRRVRRQRGMALLVVVLVLGMISALVLSALDNAGSEAASSGRVRTAARALYVAEAGIEIARSRISQNPPNLVAFDIALDGGWSVQTRSKTDAAPQPIATAGGSSSAEGYSASIGSGFASEIYLVNVTSTLPGGSTAEIEAKLAKVSAGIGGY